MNVQRMQQRELVAWHQPTREPVRVRWTRGRITAIEPFPGKLPRSLWIAPPLLDVQINGFGGVDFQCDEISPEDLLRAARGLRAVGCTRFFLTLMTDAWPRMLARLERLRALRARHVELRRGIAGWHLEGPFLWPEPGFCGAHDPSVMLPRLDENTFARSVS